MKNSYSGVAVPSEGSPVFVFISNCEIVNLKFFPSQGRRCETI